MLSTPACVALFVCSFFVLSGLVTMAHSIALYHGRREAGARHLARGSHTRGSRTKSRKRDELKKPEMVEVGFERELGDEEAWQVSALHRLLPSRATQHG